MWPGMPARASVPCHATDAARTSRNCRRCLRRQIARRTTHPPKERRSHQIVDRWAQYHPFARETRLVVCALCANVVLGPAHAPGIRRKAMDAMEYAAECSKMN